VQLYESLYCARGDMENRIKEQQLDLFAEAQCHTIPLKLLNIGAQLGLSVRRVYVSLSSAYPYQNEFLRFLGNLRQAYPQLA